MGQHRVDGQKKNPTGRKFRGVQCLGLIASMGPAGAESGGKHHVDADGVDYISTGDARKKHTHKEDYLGEVRLQRVPS